MFELNVSCSGSANARLPLGSPFPQTKSKCSQLRHKPFIAQEPVGVIEVDESDLCLPTSQRLNGIGDVRMRYSRGVTIRQLVG